MRDQTDALVLALGGSSNEARYVLADKREPDAAPTVCARDADGVHADGSSGGVVSRHRIVRQHGGGGKGATDVADELLLTVGALKIRPEEELGRVSLAVPVQRGVASQKTIENTNRPIAWKEIYRNDSKLAASSSGYPVKNRNQFTRNFMIKLHVKRHPLSRVQ